MNSSNLRMEWKNQIQKIRQPTVYCQACISQKTEPNDFMLICAICQSSIHKTHYASEIIGKTTNQNHLTHYPNIQDWKCQRCRYLLQKKFQPQIRCEFCPFQRGIMKKVVYQPVMNSRKQIWVHPQCTTWSFPLIYMKSKKRTHYFKQVPKEPTSKFWFRVQNQPQTKCTMCFDSYGYKIKCSYYSCTKFYHITCAKRIGVIRDLQSMRLDNGDQYCPIYCQQHLQAYVLDFANRLKIYTSKKQTQKVAHFTKIHNCYKIQLRNLTNSAKRSKQQEEIRSQLGKQLMIQSFQQSSMSLSVSQPHSNEMNSEESSSHSSTFLEFLEETYGVNDLNKLIQKKRGMVKRSNLSEIKQVVEQTKKTKQVAEQTKKIKQVAEQTKMVKQKNMGIQIKQIYNKKKVQFDNSNGQQKVIRSVGNNSDSMQEQRKQGGFENEQRDIIYMGEKQRQQDILQAKYNTFLQQIQKQSELEFGDENRKTIGIHHNHNRQGILRDKNNKKTNNNLLYGQQNNQMIDEDNEQQQYQQQEMNVNNKCDIQTINRQDIQIQNIQMQNIKMQNQMVDQMAEQVDNQSLNRQQQKAIINYSKDQDKGKELANINISQNIVKQHDYNKEQQQMLYYQEELMDLEGGQFHQVREQPNSIRKQFHHYGIMKEQTKKQHYDQYKIQRQNDLSNEQKEINNQIQYCLDQQEQLEVYLSNVQSNGRVLQNHHQCALSQKQNKYNQLRNFDDKILVNPEFHQQQQYAHQQQQQALYEEEEYQLNKHPVSGYKAQTPYKQRQNSDTLREQQQNKRAIPLHNKQITKNKQSNKRQRQKQRQRGKPGLIMMNVSIQSSFSSSNSQDQEYQPEI